MEANTQCFRGKTARPQCDKENQTKKFKRSSPILAATKKEHAAEARNAKAKMQNRWLSSAPFTKCSFKLERPKRGTQSRQNKRPNTRASTKAPFKHARAATTP